jgi:hypothetical protein
MFNIRRSRLDVTRKAWLLLAFVTMAEGAFNLLAMGFFVADWRSELLFSEWMDRQERP